MSIISCCGQTCMKHPEKEIDIRSCECVQSLKLVQTNYRIADGAPFCNPLLKINHPLTFAAPDRKLILKLL